MGGVGKVGCVEGVECGGGGGGGGWGGGGWGGGGWGWGVLLEVGEEAVGVECV